MFDSIFVLTDRRVLNKQIQDNIRQLDNTPGMVAYLDEKTTAQDLKNASKIRKWYANHYYNHPEISNHF